MKQREQEFRFAVMGAGKIANKFCDAVKRLPEARVAAVASKSMERAKAFAEKNGIEKAYDSYEKMLEEEKPDCVYVAATSDAHYALSKLCVEHGIAVLCEKAMFLNSAEAKEVFGLAKEKQVFVMEAMWSRFLPAVRKAKEWIESGCIGTPVCGQIRIGFHAEENPENRYFNPALGGGAAFDLTVYCYEIMTFLINRPVTVEEATAVLGETGVDVTDHVLLRFAGKPEEPDMLAFLESKFLSNLEDRLEICGTKGKIVLPRPHFASEAQRYGQTGECEEVFRDTVTENGFVYEAEEAMRCVRAGKAESETVPHALTIACAKLFDLMLQNAKAAQAECESEAGFTEN